MRVSYVIIELKRSSAKVEFHTMLGQMSRYRKLLSEVLNAKLNVRDPSVSVVALVGTRPDDVDHDEQEGHLRQANARILTHDQLIEDALASYQSYLTTARQASGLNEILAELVDSLEIEDAL